MSAMRNSQIILSALQFSGGRSASVQANIGKNGHFRCVLESLQDTCKWLAHERRRLVRADAESTVGK